MSSATMTGLEMRLVVARRRSRDGGESGELQTNPETEKILPVRQRQSANVIIKKRRKSVCKLTMSEIFLLDLVLFLLLLSGLAPKVSFQQSRSVGQAYAA
ncbi:hypothetical protein Ct61P_02561 [Colletotrichum tofieldiae]|nr:hypothetical protein Ct61P_02561 [Colletotrichum tofieldiae]